MLFKSNRVIVLFLLFLHIFITLLLTKTHDITTFLKIFFAVNLLAHARQSRVTEFLCDCWGAQVNQNYKTIMLPCSLKYCIANCIGHLHLGNLPIVLGGNFNDTDLPLISKCGT